MEQSPNIKTPDLLDTTDCLEAIDAIRSMKNFLFVIIILCLLMTGVVFCLDRTDRIDRTGCTACAVCPMNPAAACCAAAMRIPMQPPAVKAANTNEPIRAVAQTVAEPNAAAKASESKKQLPAILQFRPACWHIAMALKACNFILVLAAAMYCLTLLMSLKISLAGRLGGISHISRAFFISLFALVILLPWQVLLPGVAAGAIFLPCELLCQWHTKAQTSTFWLTMCYLRFAGLWVVVLVLFIAAQMRSSKWTKATLRRLGLVR